MGEAAARSLKSVISEEENISIIRLLSGRAAALQSLCTR